jgi:hypothetical protein
MNTETKATPVPLIDGTTWTDNWRKSDHKLKADSFIFNADDFRELLKEESVHYIRLYVGLKIEDKHDHDKIVEKMICVAADKNQKDILSSTKTENTSGIYDFSHPCPPLCLDPDSPLAGG